MHIPSDMKNSRKTKNKTLSEDQKEMIRMLLAFVVMAIIFWCMLISSSVPEFREPRLAAREAECNNSGGIPCTFNTHFILKTVEHLSHEPTADARLILEADSRAD